MKKASSIIIVLVLLLLVSCTKPATLKEVPESKANLARGTEVNYKAWGEGEKAIVFVHGFGCDLYAWEKQFEAFREDGGLKLVFIDLPGYGRSSKPHTNYDLHFFAEAVRAVVQKEHVENPVLVGHSLGTPVCRQYCLEHPGEVAGLCDVDGVYCFYDNATDEYLAALEEFAGMFVGEGCHDNIAAFVTSLAGPRTAEEITSYAMSVMPETEEYVARSTMANLIERKWWTGETISVPSYVICTQNSGLDPDNKEKMEALYPNMTYVELTDCGHFIQMEDEDVVGQALRSLLSR